MEENREPTTSSETEDVEAHGVTERPPAERPGAEGYSESPDVEAHGFGERPPAERPPAEAFTEKPVDM